MNAQTQIKDRLEILGGRHCRTDGFGRDWDAFEHAWGSVEKTPLARGLQLADAVKRTPCRTNRAGYCECKCQFTLAAVDQSKRENVALTSSPINHQRAMDQAAHLQPYDDRLIVLIPVVT